VAPDEDFSARIWHRVQISDNERWMYVSAPGANQFMHTDELMFLSISVLCHQRNTATFVYNNDITIDPTYPDQLLVTVNNSLQVYGTDYIINDVLVQFLTTPRCQ
jgi:hypothetical protein